VENTALGGGLKRGSKGKNGIEGLRGLNQGVLGGWVVVVLKGGFCFDIFLFFFFRRQENK